MGSGGNFKENEVIWGLRFLTNPLAPSILRRMETLLQNWLAEHWDKGKSEGFRFAPVPKGQAGDLAVAFFELAKKAGQSPIVLAEEVEKVLAGADFVEKTAIVGPYLNVFFSNEPFFQAVAETALKTDLCKGKEIVLEYSGPNTNKPLHLGHMRNHALGISMAHIYEAVGAKVHRVNIVNDRGVHICKSMLAYDRFGEGKTPESEAIKSDHFVGDFYVRFESALKEDPSLKDAVQEMLVQWEEGDEVTRELWKKMNDWALEGHQQTYERQGVEFEKEYLESEYYLAGKDIALKGWEEGVFMKRPDGAIVVDLSDEGLDEKVVLRPDGTSIYLTQDMAVAVARQKDFSPDEMIWVVADEQNYHFQVLFMCLAKLGILDSEHLHHLGYGLVHLPEGRMKSREGTVVDADNLMDRLSDLALASVQERHESLSDDEARVIAEQIMDGAWKFYLLSTSPRKSITFDIEQSIAFEGSTGPYLQYAAVRIRSIFNKAGVALSDDFSSSWEHLGEEEKGLGGKILEYPGVLNRAAETKNPTYIVTYLLELAQAWSSFYGAHSVLKAETEDKKNGRLGLAKKVFEVLKSGLGVLGISVPERM